MPRGNKEFRKKATLRRWTERQRDTTKKRLFLCFEKHFFLVSIQLDQHLAAAKFLKRLAPIKPAAFLQ